MKIVSHRGFWLKIEESNSALSFSRSVEHGFGIETDVRDSNGRLVISHDCPIGGELEFSSFLDIIGDESVPLAINIKADGLAGLVLQAMNQHTVKDWFVFDMSIPDMRSYINLGCRVFSRMSEVEKKPAYFDESIGIWLDSFAEEWYDQCTIRKLLSQGKQVCVVSSELHKRDYKGLWEMLKNIHDSESIMLCTDYPDKAKEYFGVK